MTQKQISQHSGFGYYWKLGGTTFTTQEIFNVSSPYFGALHNSEVFFNPTIIDIHLFAYQAEAEIALKLSDDILISQETVKNYSDTELFAKTALCLEMPSSAIDNIPQKGVETLIADR